MSARRYGRSDGNRGNSPFAILMLLQIYEQFERSPVKPPVTMALLLANILPHFVDVDFLGYSLSNIGQNCIHPQKIITALRDGDGILLNRLVLSALIHVDDMHLYYNMMSLTWKGINLEIAMGSAAFLRLVIFSVLVAHSFFVLLSYVLYKNSDFTSSYRGCAVGFSGVLFSLKYVLNHRSSDSSNVMGINIPTKYAAWAELILISIIHPNVSFIGHLCGILAGIIYVHTGLRGASSNREHNRGYTNFGGGRLGRS